MGLLIIGIIFSFLLGSALGSFVHCWAHRLYSGEGFHRHSYCPQCGQRLAWYDNIPIFSYLRLKGKCASCHKKIPKDYFWSELLGGGLLVIAFLVAWCHLGGEEGTWLALTSIRGWLVALQAIIGLVILMLIFWTDYWWLSIFTEPLLIGGVIVGLLRWVTNGSLLNIVLGGLVGGLFFALQFWASKGRWIGEGDIYLGIFLGIWLGWPLIILAILGAYILGAIIGLLLIVMGRKAWTSKLPLGVFLAPSGWLCFLWGQPAMEAYLHLIGVAN